jgi:protein SCO1
MLRSILIAALLVTAGVIQAGAADRLSASVLDHPTAVPDFALVDDNGEAFTQQQLKGHWSLLAVGYTNCPDTCPFTMADLDAVVRAIHARPQPPADPMVVFVAVDPARDKPVLKRWVEQFNPHFVGITGQKSEIDALVKGVDGFYRLGKPRKDGQYDVIHSGDVSVIDPQGRMRARISLPMPPKPTAAFLVKLMHHPQSVAQAEGAR